MFSSSVMVRNWLLTMVVSESGDEAATILDAVLGAVGESCNHAPLVAHIFVAL